MTLRTHDMLYLNEDRYENTKESFKFTLSKALEFHKATPNSILDAGCAAGEFPRYLQKKLPDTKISGMDLLPELINKAKEKVENVDFFTGSVLDRTSVSNSYDMVFMIGVHSIFDDIETWLSNLLAWTKPRGTVCVFGLINSHPIDAYIKIRTSKDDPSHRESGWNVFSRATFENIIFESDDVAAHEFHDFSIPLDLPPRADDPLRTWTQKLENGERMIVNGIGLIHDFKVLCIRKN
ncbi:MAG: class I SAM-dependent methyltransferase [Minwuia sp.]|nr:class I SAM-dependent methyltransferase [Minwuia sp.]